jgi:phage gp36-like protein
MSCYATLPDDFYTHGLRAAALPASIGAPEILAQVTASSGFADSYLERFNPPLASWGVDLTAAVCKIAAFELVASQVGFNPEAGHNMVLLDRKNDAIRWLEQVARKQANPVGVVEGNTSRSVSVPRAHSLPPRGWTRER